MEFKDLKVGDKVDVVINKGDSYKGPKWERGQTEIIAIKGVRVKQVQVKYRRQWYRETSFGSTINIPGGELAWLNRI